MSPNFQFSISPVQNRFFNVTACKLRLKFEGQTVKFCSLIGHGSKRSSNQSHGQLLVRNSHLKLCPVAVDAV